MTEDTLGIGQRRSTPTNLIFPKGVLLSGFVYRVTLQVYDTSLSSNPPIIASSYAQLWVKNVDFPQVYYFKIRQNV